MTRRQTNPLRALTDDERDWLLRVARSQAEPAAHVARAKALLAVADGESYTDAAKKLPGGALGKRSLVWFHASTGRGSPPLSLVTAVVLPSSTPKPIASASSPRLAVRRSETKTALLPGRLPHCAGLCGRLPTDCRR
jgi:hypothetical protein